VDEPDPERNDEDAWHPEFWHQCVVAFGIVAVLAAIFAHDGGLGDPRSALEYVGGGLVLAGGGALSVIGIRARSIVAVVAGFVLMAMAALFVLGIRECQGVQCPVGGD